MSQETRLEAQRRLSPANRASVSSRTRRAPDSSPIATRSPTRSQPKYPLPVGTDDVSKDPGSYSIRSGAPQDAAVSAALAKVHCDDTETIVEEGIDSRQQGQMPSLEALLIQSLRKQLALTDRMTSVETAVEKANKVARTRTMDDTFLNSVQPSTKNSAEAQGTTPCSNYQKGINIRNI